MNKQLLIKIGLAVAAAAYGAVKADWSAYTKAVDAAKAAQPPQPIPPYDWRLTLIRVVDAVLGGSGIGAILGVVTQ